MDTLTPLLIIEEMIEFGAAKSRLGVTELLIRSAMAGAILCVSVTLAFTIIGQTGLPIVAALIFPVGFAIIVVLELDLVTGSFALMPVAWMAGRVTLREVLTNWFVTFVGNTIGSLVSAVIMYVAWTSSGHDLGGIAAEKMKAVVVARSTGYYSLGFAGVATAFIKAVLCNWMVSVGVVMGLCSSTVAGKVLGSWLPIVIFFGQGFEHAVVNMSLFPLGIMLGAKTTVAKFLLANEIPVAIGNILGGVLLTGVALYVAYPRRLSTATGGELTPAE